MKKYKIKIILLCILILFLGCNKKKTIDYLEKYKKLDKNITEIICKKKVIEELYYSNFVNIKNGFPFYIIRLEAPLFKKKPSNHFSIPEDYITLEFGDIVFPIKEKNPTKYFFYVKTIDNKYGWIYSGFGISLNYKEDPDLYFFSDKYYLGRYKDVNGNIGNSNKIILIKNIVPMLLDNYTTNAWFYPSDYWLALQLSQFSVDIAINQRTHFYAASSYDWRVNEVVVCNNLLADSYQKLKFFNKAEKIHKYLLRWYFWGYADNTRIGGLNSIVKLEKIYLEQLKNEKQGSHQYKVIQEKIMETILIIGDKYNEHTLADKKWHLTAAEWVVDILRKSLTRKEFYSFAKRLSSRTASDGFSDMVNVYTALEMYKEGKQEEALKILTSIKPKKNFKPTLRINDWLSVNKIIPDSIIYQYKF